MLPNLPIIKVLLAIMGNMGRVDVATPKMSVNGASRMLCVASCKIEGLCGGVYP